MRVSFRSAYRAIDPPQVKVSSSGWAKTSNAVRDMAGLLSKAEKSGTIFGPFSLYFTIIGRCSFSRNWCILGNELIGIIYFEVVNNDTADVRNRKTGASRGGGTGCPRIDAEGDQTGTGEAGVSGARV